MAHLAILSRLGFLMLSHCSIFRNTLEVKTIHFFLKSGPQKKLIVNIYDGIKYLEKSLAENSKF